VDDHPGVLKGASRLLAGDYDVAGVATDGRQAVEMAQRLQPDAIVLDVNMPGFDGFQTLHALQQAGSRAPVVFLSMLDAETVVSEAFRSGGRGYVLKSRVADDLASAIDHVLLGRLFVPSLASLDRLTNAPGHVLHVHGGAASSLDDVAVLFDLSLRRGDATCVIASQPVCESLGPLLRARGWDIDAPAVRQRYRVIDAAGVMSSLCESPDCGVAADIAVELDQYRRAVTDRATSRLTIFGDVAWSLSAKGHPQAAIALERKWALLTRDLPFLTVCAYPASFSGDPGSDLWADICAEHGAVVHSDHS
jgi:CheY-like chemotaxis protein